MMVNTRCLWRWHLCGRLLEGEQWLCTHRYMVPFCVSLSHPVANIDLEWQMLFAMILRWIFFHSLPLTLPVVRSLMIIVSALYGVVCSSPFLLLDRMLTAVWATQLKKEQAHVDKNISILTTWNKELRETLIALEPKSYFWLIRGRYGRG